MTARQQSELLQQHPLSGAFPSMSEADVQALAEDIKKNGQRMPAVMFEGKILDGWHRYLACSAVNVKLRTVEFDGEDPVAFVLSQNLHRRHLTSSQRAASIVAATNWRKAGRPGKGDAASPFSTVGGMAKAAEVSERTIQRAKAAEEAGLGDAVRKGEVSVDRAAQVAKLPAKQREKALRDPAPKKPSGDAAKLQARIEELEGIVERQKEALAELADTDKSVEAFKDDAQFKEMQVLRAELRSCRKRRDELMNENAQLKTEVKRWRKKAGAK